MPYSGFTGGGVTRAYMSAEFMKRFQHYIESELSDPLFKVETYIDRCDLSDQTYLRSRVREHMVEIDDFIERQLLSKGFVRLRPNEALGEWRKCPLCEIGSKEPHKCWDGLLLEPMER